LPTVERNNDAPRRGGSRLPRELYALRKEGRARAYAGSGVHTRLYLYGR